MFSQKLATTMYMFSSSLVTSHVKSITLLVRNDAFVFSLVKGDAKEAISAASVDVGSTIFDDDHSVPSYLMWALYVKEYPLQAAIDIAKRWIK